MLQSSRYSTYLSQSFYASSLSVLAMKRGVAFVAERYYDNSVKKIGYRRRLIHLLQSPYLLFCTPVATPPSISAGALFLYCSLAAAVLATAVRLSFAAFVTPHCVRHSTGSCVPLLRRFLTRRRGGAIPQAHQIPRPVCDVRVSLAPKYPTHHQPHEEAAAGANKHGDKYQAAVHLS